jgi:hypothetical protein
VPRPGVHACHGGIPLHVLAVGRDQLDSAVTFAVL